MTKRVTDTYQTQKFNILVWYRGTKKKKDGSDLKDNHTRKDGTAFVYLVVHCKRVKCVFNTGVSVSTDDWDSENLRVRKNNNQVNDYNLMIDECKSRLNEIFVKYRLQHIELTPQLLKKEYVTPTSYIDFYHFVSRAQNKLKDTLEPRTIHHHKAIFEKLKKFKPVLMFSEIDEDFIQKYKTHLQQKYKNEPWTIYNNLAKIKSYLNIAKKEGIIRRNPFDLVKLKKPGSEREYLTEEELTKLVNYYEQKRLPENYQRTLRYFLFSCVTSLRISDVRALKKDMIMYNMITYVPKKTKNQKPQAIRIPLTDYAKKLINDEPARTGASVFNMLPDSKINANIKEIIKIKECRIVKDISFHTARHTFATIFLRRTKNILALQKLLGHTDIKVTMIYAHLLSEDLVMEMNNFNEVIPLPAKSLQKQ